MDNPQRQHDWSATEQHNNNNNNGNNAAAGNKSHASSPALGVVDPSSLSYSTSNNLPATTTAATTLQYNSNTGPFSNAFDESFVSQMKLQSQAGDEFSALLASDFTMYPTANTSTTAATAVGDFAAHSLMLDPQFETAAVHAGQSINPADLSNMSSSPHNPTPPHLAPPDTHSSRPASPVATSPSTATAAYYTPQHSRHTSLDPITAAYMNQQQQQQHHQQPSEWQGLIGNPSFQTHRRAPSEHSDVSSVAHSPFMAQHESFDGGDGSHSPMLNPQDPNMYDNAFGIDSFTISDANHHQGFSPGHSPYISPRLSPQQQQRLVDLPPDIHLAQHVSAQLGSAPSPSDPYVVTNLETSPHPTIHSQNSPSDMGQAAQMAPPSINVEFAPPSRTSSFGPAHDGDNDALSPPSRNRGRSKSDPFGQSIISRPRSTSSSAVPITSSTLSPFPRTSGGAVSTPASREPSPSGKARRLSTSSLDSRNYILDLADPQRPSATATGSGRAQKHPATFQCTLCPKRFTRAYNLRSHLRTHTDERPFVCTVCGKAFARQHDRKRHEGLHSGEKKFVCRGDLSRGGHWGCGRRFARADALGRHFRSEAGRVCIKPLLDEEAHERKHQPAYAGAGGPQQDQQLSGHLQPVPQPLTLHDVDGQGVSSSTAAFTLPAALLAQYPALQTLQWDQLGTQPADDGGDLGGGGGTGRNSFDASSGGEFGFGDEDDNGGYVSGSGAMQQHQQPQHPHLMGMDPTVAGGGWPQQSTHGWPSELFCLQRRSRSRRQLLHACIRLEEESFRSQKVKQSKTEDDDWERLEIYNPGRTEGESLPADSDWNGIIAFFHPFCNAGGGGERVLWAAVRATQRRWPNAICAIYTGDQNADKVMMLENIERRFNIRLHPPTVVFLYLTTREYVLSSTYPRFTLLGQSLGSLVLAYDAFNLLVPDIFIDTMGYSFTLCLSHFLFPSIPTGAYVHYPIISTDMLESLDDTSGTKGLNAGTGKGWKGRAKRQYWKAFARLYGWVGGTIDVVMCNSSWTSDHIRALWLPARERRKQQHRDPSVIHPPVAVRELESIKIDLQAEREIRQPSILYIAQFRPEKNHTLILRAFARFLKNCDNAHAAKTATTIPPTLSPKLILIGSVRPSSPDETHIYNLRLLAHELRIRDHTTFICDASWAVVLQHLRRASVGTNAMWNEHFGIGVVEYQAAGLISVVHDSGGPKCDIVVDMDAADTTETAAGGSGATGFHATTEEEFVAAFETALALPLEEKVAMRLRARRSARRFSDEEFARKWIAETEKLIALQVRQRRRK